MSFKFFYYIKRFGYNKLPGSYFEKKYEAIKEFEANCNSKELEERLNYYLKLDSEFEISGSSVKTKDFRKTKGTEYYLDFKEFLHYFSDETSFSYRFGDETKVNSFPTILKARPINGQNENSILFKLNKKRHFKWVDDPYSFAEKENKMVWRGGAYLSLRREFVKVFWDHHLCNVGQTNRPKENVDWQKDFLSIEEHLKYKFIFCPEGNDVATNLKWVMSSNSLCFMPKPKFETWFMEGVLEAGVHYVELENDYSDLEDKILYYSKNVQEAERIIKRAHEHVRRFQNPEMEDLLCFKVLEKYAKLSNQKNAVKFI